MAFKVVIKNGDVDYQYNQKTGQYDSKKVDSVTEYKTLPEALAEYLYSIEDYGQPGQNKASLVYVPENKGKK